MVGCVLGMRQLLVVVVVVAAVVVVVVVVVLFCFKECRASVSVLYVVKVCLKNFNMARQKI